jgi:surface protein
VEYVQGELALKYIPPIPFTSLADLKQAVDKCIAATETCEHVAPDVPPGSGRFCCSRCGADCKDGYDMPDWDVGQVTSFAGLFQDKAAFDEDLSTWNTSLVTDMSYTFHGATAFNQPIGDWNVSSVTNMHVMFQSATAFNQPIGDWDVSSVMSMRGMFFRGTAFNQPIGDWNVSSVTNMQDMFFGATACSISRSGPGTYLR